MHISFRNDILYHILEILALIQRMVNNSWIFTKQKLVPENKDMFTKRIREDIRHSHRKTKTHPLQIAQEKKRKLKRQDTIGHRNRNSQKVRKSFFPHSLWGFCAP